MGEIYPSSHKQKPPLLGGVFCVIIWSQ